MLNTFQDIFKFYEPKYFDTTRRLKNINSSVFISSNSPDTLRDIFTKKYTTKFENTQDTTTFVGNSCLLFSFRCCRFNQKIWRSHELISRKVLLRCLIYTHRHSFQTFKFHGVYLFAKDFSSVVYKLQQSQDMQYQKPAVKYISQNL